MKRLFFASLILLFTCLYAYGDTEVIGGGGIQEGSDVGFGNMTATSFGVGLGSESTPAITLGENRDTGFFSLLDGYIYVVMQGTTQYRFLNYAFVSGINDGFYIPVTAPTATNPIYTFANDTNTGIGRAGAEQVSIISDGAESARFDNNSTASNTRFMLYDVDNDTLERVTVGAADSGGAGYKVLRIPN